MIPFPRPICSSRERDKETAPSKTEVETMARAGAFSCSCMFVCACGRACLCVLIVLLCFYSTHQRAKRNLCSHFYLQQLNPGAIVQSEHQGGSAPPPSPPHPSVPTQNILIKLTINLTNSSSGKVLERCTKFVTFICSHSHWWQTLLKVRSGNVSHIHSQAEAKPSGAIWGSVSRPKVALTCSNHRSNQKTTRSTP